MNIYVSGTYNEQTRLREEANKLFKLGFTITSTWLHESRQPSHLTQEQWYKNLALKDLVDLASADCIILDVDGISSTGGRYVEWGFAIGRSNMLKIVVGDQQPAVFGQLADLSFIDWNNLLIYFKDTYVVS